jgi:class 3 adenylate cyclase
LSQTRRLAAILAADVAGYSRLMGADEEGTLERLKALRRELVDPKIGEHKGRIVKTTGDGLLVEFASVVDAARCAVEVQQAMPERNTGIAADSRIELRIGINLGDVIVEGDDLYGRRRRRCYKLDICLAYEVAHARGRSVRSKKPARRPAGSGGAWRGDRHHPAWQTRCQAGAGRT